MGPEVFLNGKKIEVKVVAEADAELVLTPEEMELDAAVKQAVTDAINRAERLGLPIAGYDEDRKKAYTRYSDGRRVYAEDLE